MTSSNMTTGGVTDVKTPEMELRTPDSGYSSVSSHGGSRSDFAPHNSVTPSVPPFPQSFPVYFVSLSNPNEVWSDSNEKFGNDAVQIKLCITFTGWFLITVLFGICSSPGRDKMIKTQVVLTGSVTSTLGSSHKASPASPASSELVSPSRTDRTSRTPCAA